MTAANILTHTDVFAEFKRMQESVAEPCGIVMHPDLAREVTICVRVDELAAQELLFDAFCAGYKLRRASSPVKITTRVLKAFRKFCLQVARDEVGR